MKLPVLFAVAGLLGASLCWSSDETVKAAVGGGLGGAAGAAIGEQLGDRTGAIVGGAIGGAVGAAVATDPASGADAPEHRRDTGDIRPVPVPVEPHPGRHCPPGQAKKGRC